MAIDLKKVKTFWESRAKSHLRDSSLTNLEKNKKRRELKLAEEEKKVLDFLPLSKEVSLLDLGGGFGFWAFKFSPKIKEVCIVEYCRNLINWGKNKAEELRVKNVHFVEARAQDFKSNQKFDIIFISGLIIYLNDYDFLKLLKNMKRYSKRKAFVVLRDGTGIISRFEIIDRYSEELNANYSATYRTREEYIKFFNDAGFELVKDENMFREGSPLNKFPETRLRIYLFRNNS